MPSDLLHHDGYELTQTLLLHVLRFVTSRLLRVACHSGLSRRFYFVKVLGDLVMILASRLVLWVQLLQLGNGMSMFVQEREH